MPNLDSRLNVIIPACGLGQRFIDAGHTTPKPFIQVAERPMVQWVLDGLPRDSNATILLQHGTPEALGRKLLKCNVVGLSLPEYADGAAKTVLRATQYIPLTAPVLVVNCDNVIYPEPGEFGWLEMIRSWVRDGADGGIVTFRPDSVGPFSYVRESSSGVVGGVAEKVPIGPYACAGAFWFSSYALLHAAVYQHLREGRPDFQKEYYLAPVYAQLIANGLKVMHTVLSEEDTFVRIGVPSDLPAAEEALYRAQRNTTL